MKKILIPFFTMLLLSLQIKAQVKTNFNNVKRVNARGQFNKSYLGFTFEITPPDLKNALRRDKTEDSLGSKVFYIAEPVATNINVAKLVNWVSDEKYSYGKFTLIAKGAKTLSINFSNFFLPKGTEMFIYNKEAEMITGVVTEKENNESRIWGSSIYKGDELNIEVKLPIAEKEKLSLFVTNVAYGYKDIFINKVAGFGQSGACNINVLCPLGNNWVAERNSVVYIARSNGDALCSGAMLMNTCATNIPYVLTADHCFNPPGQPQQNLSQWRVHFQAWSATCTPSQNSDGILFNGSTLRANWAPSDFCLIQLNQTPDANSGIHYAGWSRQTSAATSGVGIHHPSGDVMKISDYTTPLVREDDPIRCNVNAVGQLHWVVQWNQGVTESGSSGSPLFDQNHRIVGQLSGGPSSCSQPANCKMDMYGRFDNSWTGGGTNATRLSNWLDPSGTGAITTNTTNVNSLVTPGTGGFSTIVGAGFICGSEIYSIANLPAGFTVTWQVTQVGNIVSSTTSGNSITLNKLQDGSVDLNAMITSNGCNAPAVFSSKKIIVGTGTTGLFWLHGQNFDYTATGPGNYYSVCPNEYLWFEPYYGSSGNPATAHVWTISGNYTLLSGLNGSTLSLQAPPGVGNNFSISYQYYSACGGWSDIAYGGAGVMNCAGGEEPYRISNPTVEKELPVNSKTGVYPNPAKTTLVIDIPYANPKGMIVLSDMNNRQVYQATISGKRNVINVSSLSNGIYLLRLIINGKVETTKVVISK